MSIYINNLWTHAIYLFGWISFRNWLRLRHSLDRFKASNSWDWFRRFNGMMYHCRIDTNGITCRSEKRGVTSFFSITLRANECTSPLNQNCEIQLLCIPYQYKYPRFSVHFFNAMQFLECAFLLPNGKYVYMICQMNPDVKNCLTKMKYYWLSHWVGSAMTHFLPYLIRYNTTLPNQII